MCRHVLNLAGGQGSLSAPDQILCSLWGCSSVFFFLCSVWLIWKQSWSKISTTNNYSKSAFVDVVESWELLKAKDEIRWSVCDRLNAPELIWSCGRWKLLQQEKWNTSVDVWTPDAGFHFALSLVLFLLSFHPHLLLLKQFIKHYRVSV